MGWSSLFRSVLFSPFEEGIPVEINRLGVLAAFCVFGSTIASANDSKEVELFKNFTLSVCVGSAYRDPVVLQDANNAANAYMQQGNLDLDVYEKTRTLVDTWLARQYRSKHGGSLQLMKCIDLVKSNELELLFSAQSPCNSREGWRNEEHFQEFCSPRTSTDEKKGARGSLGGIRTR
jgi:hypothetical protein